MDIDDDNYNDNLCPPSSLNRFIFSAFLAQFFFRMTRQSKRFYLIRDEIIFLQQKDHTAIKSYKYPAAKMIPGTPVTITSCLQSLMPYAIAAKSMTNTS